MVATPAVLVTTGVSLSARGAWIEMLLLVPVLVPSCSSLSARGAWIEMLTGTDNYTKAIRSLSARGAWIEISRAPRICRSASSRSPQGERG